MKKIIMGFIALNLLSACTVAPNSVQKMELEVYKQKGMAVEAKDPAIGILLGFLPGGGSFYVNEYGYGLLNFITWPFSTLWDPINGANGSQMINYAATKVHVDKLKQKEMDRLDEELALSKIDIKQYSIEKSKVEKKYSATLF